MDTQRLGFAEWPGHNWCKMRRRRRVAFHISDKTYFRPKLPACPQIKSADSRMLLNPKPAGQHANAAIHPAAQFEAVATTTPFSSWDLAPKVSESQSGSRNNPTHNENTRKRQQKLHSSSAVA